MLLGSKVHTAGDTKRWKLDFHRWLDNTATIVNASVTSSSETCTVRPAPKILGKEVIFFLTGGTVGETLTVSVMIEDSFGNIKNDTVAYTVIAP